MLTFKWARMGHLEKIFGKEECICRNACHGNFRHASSSHTMSYLSDVQRFRGVLAPGTEARSCCHDTTVMEPGDSVWTQWEGIYSGVLWSTVVMDRATADSGWWRWETRKWQRIFIWQKEKGFSFHNQIKLYSGSKTAFQQVLDVKSYFMAQTRDSSSWRSS